MWCAADPANEGLLSYEAASALGDLYVELKGKLATEQDPTERAAIEAQIMAIEGDAADAEEELQHAPEGAAQSAFESMMERVATAEQKAATAEEWAEAMAQKKIKAETWALESKLFKANEDRRAFEMMLDNPDVRLIKTIVDQEVITGDPRHFLNSPYYASAIAGAVEQGILRSDMDDQELLTQAQTLMITWAEVDYMRTCFRQFEGDGDLPAFEDPDVLEEVLDDDDLMATMCFHSSAFKQVRDPSFRDHDVVVAGIRERVTEYEEAEAAAEAAAAAAEAEAAAEAATAAAEAAAAAAAEIEAAAPAVQSPSEDDEDDNHQVNDTVTFGGKDNQVYIPASDWRKVGTVVTRDAAEAAQAGTAVAVMFMAIDHGTHLQTHMIIGPVSDGPDAMSNRVNAWIDENVNGDGRDPRLFVMSCLPQRFVLHHGSSFNMGGLSEDAFMRKVYDLMVTNVAFGVTEGHLPSNSRYR